MEKAFRKYFWDTDFDKLDIKENKNYIISRLLNYGDIKELDWIKSNYSKEELKDFAKQSRNLNPLLANYLSQKLELDKNEMNYYNYTNKTNYDFRKRF